jgi:CelD/BcsL family acetyltransferase involved in cellulose biosynthesis
MTTAHQRRHGLAARVTSPLNLRSPETAVWTMLCQSNPHLNSPFYTVEYIRAVAQSMGDVYVCVIEENERPVAFLPFQFRNKLWKLIGFAERAGGDLTDYFGLIAPRGFQVDVPTLLSMANLQYLYFTHLDESQLAHGLDGQQPEPGMKIEISDTSEYWADLKKRSPDVVSELGRRERKLVREFGELRFCFEERNWHEPSQDLLTRKSRQYIESGGADILNHPGKQRLLRRLLESRSSDCRAVLSTLYAGETWVASHLGLRGRNVLHYWFPAYNPDLRNFGPGMLLLKAVINGSPAEGISIVDRGSGSGAHKTKFANQSHQYYRGTWESSGFASGICYLACSVQIRLDRLKDSVSA